MFTVTKYPHGTFSWADCASTDATKGRQFYIDLMGWEPDDQPMGEGQIYTMYKFEGEHVAALSQMQPEQMEMGIPSFWSSYISVDDVDAMAGKVTELGGTVIMEPFDVFDAGRMLFLQDPTGAQVALWQAKNHIGAGLVNTPGAMAWNELMTGNAEQARDFYGKLLGWDFHKMEGQDYYVIMVNGRSNGGIMQMTDDMGDFPPGWVVYFSVSNVDSTVQKAQSLGGNVLIPATEATGVGRFAMISDAAGAVASFIQLNEPEAWPG